ncbi:MAG: citrate lyase acyl carrier protein [Clostridia bacterium]|nr:citrate lyase acyl carrier protein [Clostridia bacterium]
MEIKKYAVAGTMESSDAFVEIEPSGDGIIIELESVVEKQFGESIKKTVIEVLTQQGVKNAIVRVKDRGALDCAIRARVETAILRGKEEN